MGLDLVQTGKDVPNEVNVIIEIPKDAEPVKYEVDKATGAISSTVSCRRRCATPAITVTFRTPCAAMAIRQMYLSFCRCRWSRARLSAAVRSVSCA